MENKHTEGEWKVNDYAYYLIMCNNTLIANVNTSHIDCGDNAKLIAAAPDLLEALIESNKLLVKLRDKLSMPQYGIVLPDRLIERNFKAINKAHGK